MKFWDWCTRVQKLCVALSVFAAVWVIVGIGVISPIFFFAALSILGLGSVVSVAVNAWLSWTDVAFIERS